MVKPFQIWKTGMSNEDIKNTKSSIDKLNEIGKDSLPIKNVIGNSETILKEIEKEVNAHNSAEAQLTENALLEENKIIGTNLDNEISKIQKLKEKGKTEEVNKLIESN